MKDMIRHMTPPSFNKRVDEETLRDLERYKDASPEEIEQRLKMLAGEFDLECMVELFGATFSLIGVGLCAATKKHKWMWISAIASGLTLIHSLPLWDPLTPLFRGLGFWSRQEIEREKAALKLLRGDFERVAKDASPKSALATAQGEHGLKEPTGMGARPPAAKPIEAGPELR